MRIRSSALILAAFILSSAGHSAPQADLDQKLEQYRYFTNSPALLGTLCEGDSCQSSAVGHTTFSLKEPVTTRSLFSIGSNSKLLTAILTLKMVDQGILSLDDHLEDLFPEYQLWQGVTIRHLLQHSSGVPPYLFSKDGLQRTFLSVFNWRWRIWKPADIIRLVSRDPLIFTPGSRIEYNNTNYILLGMILEKKSGLSLADLMRTHLTDPLGMEDTYVSLPPREAPRRMAGYMPLQIPGPDWLFNLVAQKVDKRGDYVETTHIFHDSMTWAAGGMVSTTADLAKVVRSLVRGDILSPELTAAMMDVKPGTVLGMPFVYGLGLMKIPTVYGDLYGHGGLTPGYQTMSNYLPARDTTLILSQNLAPGQLYSIYFDFLDIISGARDYRDFLPSDTVSMERLDHQGIHVRMYGLVANSQDPESPFPRSFGYTKAKGLRPETAYQSFNIRQVKKGDQDYLEIEASSGGGILATSLGGGNGLEFLRIRVHPEDFETGTVEIPAGSLQAKGIFVYRGLKSKDPQGKTEECLYDVIDRSRPLNIQIDWGDVPPQVGSTVKLVGNLPLKPLSMASVPEELDDTVIKICR